MTFHSTLFLNGTFHDETFIEYGALVAPTKSLLREIIRQMKNRPPHYLNPWEEGIWEPGMWEENRLREIIRDWEKKK